MLKQYETVFILTPVLSETQVRDAVDKFRTILTDNGATILHEEDWGLRKLAYPIQKKNTGFYYLMEFTAPANAIEVLNIEYRRDERVIRDLTVTLDKHAIAYSEKRRKGAKGKEVSAEAKTEE
ncbi:MAG: 30S ribosomal protein S6 [Spirosomataceae bacterium]